ncbi:hypothetical protein HYPSUDRAFT_523742 [Hypholoma sublateritium FD-334 SS-4]|uniref:Uncharacterized protein n=1 Tax=Hypholoma sublateritium (strain FD-334 SS-4) TaxID=945553 RepID=A0A0D2QCX0_HYPSF|nr:hypothetical protein HYPSUDRAFT_523742 [Hypholoma sublateritium FD-334 SS-4]
MRHFTIGTRSITTDDAPEILAFLPVGPSQFALTPVCACNFQTQNSIAPTDVRRMSLRAMTHHQMSNDNKQNPEKSALAEGPFARCGCSAVWTCPRTYLHAQRLPSHRAAYLELEVSARRNPQSGPPPRWLYPRCPTRVGAGQRSARAAFACASSGRCHARPHATTACACPSYPYEYQSPRRWYPSAPHSDHCSALSSPLSMCDPANASHSRRAPRCPRDAVSLTPS